jgi:hypothetical protein
VIKADRISGHDRMNLVDKQDYAHDTTHKRKIAKNCLEEHFSNLIKLKRTADTRSLSLLLGERII